MARNARPPTATRTPSAYLTSRCSPADSVARTTASQNATTAWRRGGSRRGSGVSTSPSESEGWTVSTASTSYATS